MIPRITQAPGHKKAIQVLHCGCEIDTQLSMRMFQIPKGHLTECPNNHGPQKTKQVRSENWK